MQDQLATLETQLQEKQELVSALTARLERTAERLERIRRTGGNDNVRLAGGLPPEVVDEHRRLVGDLQRAVGRWEKAQPGAALGRIEGQIAELRGMVSEWLASSSAAPNRVNAGVEEPDDADPQDNERSSWEALKADFLRSDDLDADGDGSGEQSSGATDDSEETTDAAETFSDEAVTDDGPLHEPPPPVPVDFDEATLDQLHEAVETRDAYISFLIKKLRAAENWHTSRLPDWAQLQDVPEELRQRLEELETRLTETLRISEVELSLERARLGREDARLRQTQHQVEQKINALGASGNGREPAAKPGSAEAADRKGRRLLRFLGNRCDESKT